MHATLTVQSRITSVLGLLGRKEGKNGKGQPGIAAGTRPTDSANELAAVEHCSAFRSSSSHLSGIESALGGKRDKSSG